MRAEPCTPDFICLASCERFPSKTVISLLWTAFIFLHLWRIAELDLSLGYCKFFCKECRHYFFKILTFCCTCDSSRSYKHHFLALWENSVLSLKMSVSVPFLTPNRHRAPSSLSAPSETPLSCVSLHTSVLMAVRGCLWSAMCFPDGTWCRADAHEWLVCLPAELFACGAGRTQSVSTKDRNKIMESNFSTLLQHYKSQLQQQDRRFKEENKRGEGRSLSISIWR